MVDGRCPAPCSLPFQLSRPCVARQRPGALPSEGIALWRHGFYAWQSLTPLFSEGVKRPSAEPFSGGRSFGHGNFAGPENANRGQIGATRPFGPALGINAAPVGRLRAARAPAHRAVFVMVRFFSRSVLTGFPAENFANRG